MNNFKSKQQCFANQTEFKTFLEIPAGLIEFSAVLSLLQPATLAKRDSRKTNPKDWRIGMTISIPLSECFSCVSTCARASFVICNNLLR